MGEVPASPETAPFNSGGPPELKPPTAPEPTMPIEMNIRMATETTTTGALSGVSDDKLVEPKLVLVDTRLPPGRVGQAEPAQQPQPPAQLDGQVPGQLGNKTRAWDLAKDSPDSTWYRCGPQRVKTFCLARAQKSTRALGFLATHTLSLIDRDLCDSLACRGDGGGRDLHHAASFQAVPVDTRGDRPESLHLPQHRADQHARQEDLGLHRR